MGRTLKLHDESDHAGLAERIIENLYRLSDPIPLTGQSRLVGVETVEMLSQAVGASQ